MTEQHRAPSVDSSTGRRVILNGRPFDAEMNAHGLWRRGHWPAHWIGPAPAVAPVVFAARYRFITDASFECRIHVSADERYELLLDGRLIGRGPERGDLSNWFFETYDLNLSAGSHELSARVWAMGPAAPRAQISAGAGFLLAAEGHANFLSTGVAPWEVRSIDGITTINHSYISHDGFTGKKHRHDARRQSNSTESGDSTGWIPATVFAPACGDHACENVSRRLLRPALLPPMLSQWITTMSCRFAERDLPGELLNLVCDPSNNCRDLCQSIDALLQDGRPLIVPAGASLRAVVDLGDYYCGYTHLDLSDGTDATVRVAWAESLYTSAAHDDHKGNRNDIDGKFFRGSGDEFVGGGIPHAFRSLWWNAGRYLQIEIRTGQTPLTINRLAIEETRYPLTQHRHTEGPSHEWSSILKLCVRSIEVGTHEHFTDSPYYEQLGYIGDARLEALSWYCLTDDDRPVRKQLELIDSSRLASGFTQSRAPCPVPQLIPTFSLIYVEMVNDFARERRDGPFVRQLLPGVRHLLDAFIARIDTDGLLSDLPGWLFVDWAGGHFVSGEIAPESRGKNAPVNLMFVLALSAAASLERFCGDELMAEKYERLAEHTLTAVVKFFWVETRRAFADDLQQTVFSQHAQILSLLTHRLDPDRQAVVFHSLIDGTGLEKPTIYFRHYLFEVLRQNGRADLIDAHLDPWLDAVALGLKCTPEGPEPSRSDSHAWSAHLIYHATKLASADPIPR